MTRTFISSCLLCIALCGCASSHPRLDKLTVLEDNWPRAFFFRGSEGKAIQLKDRYPTWDGIFSRLMGIEGKTLEEEVPGRSANINFFTRFKKDHPDQLVLLHYNGNARDPRDAQKFFAGHWVYYNGATIEADVPAEPGPDGLTKIKVSDARLFVVNQGRYKNSNDDIGLCALGDDGKPDWSRSEQVQLVSVDRKAGLIVVKRGCYGTTPRAFAAGKAYTAAHVSEGPWGKHSNLLWYYNHSLACPRDAQGRTADDVLVADLVEHFAPGGDLAAYDGLEFDVLFHTRHRHGGRRGLDTDADGISDFGYIDGVNEYGSGVIKFLSDLRAKLGDDRLILADGHHDTHQRGFEILNGIESEGWPSLRDHDVDDWSGGLNRHFYWAQHARAPVFNYTNHKFIERGEKPGQTRQAEVPWRIHRLVMAAGLITDSAICYSTAPPAEPDESFGIWDELRKGTEHELGWLGKPVGEPIRMATSQPNLLAGMNLAAKMSAEGAMMQVNDNQVTLVPTPIAREEEEPKITLTLHDVPCDGSDLYLTMTAAGEPMAAYPSTIGRLVEASIGKQAYQGWLGPKPFENGYYFKGLAGESVDVAFTFEGREPITIMALAAYAAPDVIVRVYENGLVVANPASHPVTVDLQSIRPGNTYRRLQGSSKQDPKTNDGSVVTGPLQLDGKDAIFLVRQ
ncbi:hypothetical protein HED60_16210 [Planctomycetales bacterium ZRK34]|nr:hypothetical protein HED60_16210 [Planctomycetales bacterium ZRK34]